MLKLKPSVATYSHNLKYKPAKNWSWCKLAYFVTNNMKNMHFSPDQVVQAESQMISRHMKMLLRFNTVSNIPTSTGRPQTVLFLKK